MNTSKLAKFLDAKRDERGWSFNELGRQGGISGSQVANVLSARSPPGLDFLLAMADAFDIGLDELLRAADLLPLLPEDADPALREAWRILHDLSPADLDTVVAMLRGLADKPTGD